MSLIKKINWNLLARDLAGEAGDKEKSDVAEWLGKDARNRILYKELNNYWRMMDKMNKTFDVDQAWNKVYDRIQFKGDATVSDTTIYPGKFRLIMRIAATVALLALLGVATRFFYNSFNTVKYTASSNERGKSIELPDGSTVYLNNNASVKYARSFNKETRVITLNGEAYFEVQPDTKRPFIVNANNAVIKVVGTSFNVNSKSSANNVEVYVTSGMVELTDKRNLNHIMLSPGYIGSLSNNEIRSELADNKNSIAWRTGNISFDNLLLSEAVSLISDLYYVNIVCTDSVANSTRFEKGEHFDNESLDVILRVICMQNNLKVEKSGNMIYLSGY